MRRRIYPPRKCSVVGECEYPAYSFSKDGLSFDEALTYASRMQDELDSMEVLYLMYIKSEDGEIDLDCSNCEEGDF